MNEYPCLQVSASLKTDTKLFYADFIILFDKKYYNFIFSTDHLVYIEELNIHIPPN